MPEGESTAPKHWHHWVKCWCDLPHLICSSCSVVKERVGETQAFGKPLLT